MTAHRLEVPVDPALLARLGTLIVRWSLIEQLLCDLFAATISAPPGPLQIVTQSTSAATVTEWIRTAINVRPTPPETKAEIEDILNDIDEARAERNALVHGLWGTDKSPPGTAMVQTVRLGREPPIRDRLVTAADLDVLVDETLALRQRLFAFLRRHGFAPP